MRRAAARSLRPASTVARALLVAAAISAAHCLGAQDAAPRRALLVSGADRVRGLPFFPPNAIPALVGAYGPDSEAPQPAAAGSGPAAPSPLAAETRVWFTREALVMGGAWLRRSVGLVPAFLLADEKGSFLVLKEPSYFLCFGLPAGAKADDAATIAFIRAFERKFGAFFDNAASEAEISFPAFVDY